MFSAQRATALRLGSQIKRRIHFDRVESFRVVRKPVPLTQPQGIETVLPMRIAPPEQPIRIIAPGLPSSGQRQAPSHGPCLAAGDTNVRLHALPERPLYRASAGLEASLGRGQTCALYNTFLFLCPFNKLIEPSRLADGMSRRLTCACLPVMPTTRAQLQQIAQRRTTQQPTIQLQPAHTFSDPRERVFHTVGFHPEPPHDPFQHDQVLPDIRGDPPQVVTSGVASTADATRWATLAPATPAAW